MTLAGGGVGWQLCLVVSEGLSLGRKDMIIGSNITTMFVRYYHKMLVEGWHSPGIPHGVICCRGNWISMTGDVCDDGLGVFADKESRGISGHDTWGGVEHLSALGTPFPDYCPQADYFILHVDLQQSNITWWVLLTDRPTMEVTIPEY